MDDHVPSLPRAAPRIDRFGELRIVDQALSVSGISVSSATSEDPVALRP
jgi:hypothetical protein